MENFVFKCKGCGNDLDSQSAVNGIVECEYCGMARTVPKQETKPAALSYLMLAEHDLEVCAFDNAFTGYKKAAEVDGNEPEAYFGMALARFNVQYLKDLSGQKIRLQPICHEISDKISDKKFCEDENYKKALEKATPSQRTEYEKKGKEIDYIREEFRKLQEQGLDYDCFLCVKVTDDGTGLRTKDYKRADDIYFNLRKKGYKPFFSERELDNVTGADYEARILYALYSSECMIVVCGNENYLQTPWVKNEYTRFLKLIRDEEKESDSIALAWFSSPIEKLAGKRGKIQGINLDALDASERITAFVENHTPQAKLRREEEKRKKEREVEEQRRKLEDIEERLKTVSTPISASAPAQGVSADANAILFRAKQEAEFGDFVAATQYYQKAIEVAPQMGECWWGAFLCNYKTIDENKIFPNLAFDDIARIRKDKNYIFATRNAQGELKDRISAFAQALTERENFLKEEAERVAREKAEAERKRNEEEERLSYERKNDPTIYNYDSAEFEIRGNVLARYKGNKSEGVKIPRGVKTIGTSAFSNRTSLKKIIIPEGVTLIGASAFNGCSSLLSVTIPDSVIQIGDYAFAGCISLTHIDLPDGVVVIGREAFYNCVSLTNITIPNHVTSISHFLFHGCRSLTSVTIPTSITEIGEYAFERCSALTSVTIPNSVTLIGASAFRDCTLLKSIDIPNSVNLIGTRAFACCTSLTSVKIPNSVTSIGISAFFGCISLASVMIPDGVKSIESSAFYNCTSLESVNIGNDVDFIGTQTFYDCSSLTSVTIPNNVNSIGAGAFGNCTALTNVTMSKGFKKNRKNIFVNCKKIKFTFTK